MDLVELAPGARKRFRLALYGALALLVGALALAVWLLGRDEDPKGDQTWFSTDYSQHPDVLLLQRYARIDTSDASGTELAGARFLAAELERAGLEPRLERLGDKHANLWALLEGDDPEALVLHNHIDVSPIRDPESWTVEPFGGEIEGPWIYGRGVFDMKSVAVAQLRALLDIAARGKPRRSILFLATGSEEMGSELGTRWVLERYPELRRRMWAVLTEGGVVEPTTRVDIKYWGIEFAQRRFADGYACSSDRAALERLREEILDWRLSVQRRTITPEVTAFLSAYARSRTSENFQEILTGTWRAAYDVREFRRLPKYLQSMFRSELVPFEIEPAADGGFEMRLSFHLLPGDDYESVRDRLLPAWLGHDVSLVLREPLGTGRGSPLDHPVFTTLAEVVENEYPETTVGPYFLPWAATDSRFFRAAGVPAYGFSPFVIFSTDTFRVDAANERIDLPGFVRGVELYGQVVRELAGGD